MKKVVLSIVFFLALFAFVKPKAIQAFAVNDFGLKVERLSASETVDGTVIPAGNLKVTLTLSNNTGYAGAGFKCMSNPSKVEPVKHVDGSYVTVYGPAGNSSSFYETYNPSQGAMTFGIAVLSNNYNSGDIVTYYLKAKPNVNINNENITNLVYSPIVDNFNNAATQQLDYSVPDEFTYTVASATYSYVLADLNGDGVVSLHDAQLFELLIDQYGPSIAIDATDSGLTYSSTTPYQGLFININGVETLVLCVADVNFDGVVDGTDQHLVLVYYVSVVVSGQDYSGEIGETQTKVTYVVTFP